jgi:diguanylate cyclase (GGDEF)-like protein
MFRFEQARADEVAAMETPSLSNAFGSVTRSNALPTTTVEDSRRRYWDRILAGRSITITFLCIVVAVAPMFGSHRGFIAAVLGAASLAQNAVLHRALRRTGSLPKLMPVMDYGFAAAIGIFFPSLFPWALTIVSMSITFSAIAYGRKFAYRLITAFAGPYLAIGLWQHPPYWVVGIGIFLIATPFTALVVGQLSEAERSLNGKYADLLQQLRVVVWESDGPGRPFTYINSHVSALLGFTQEQWSEWTFWLERVHPSDRELFKRPLNPTSSEPAQRSYRIITEAGKTLEVLELVTLLSNDPDGKIRGIVLDITAQRLAEEHAEQLGRFVDQIPLGLFVLHAPDIDDESSLSVTTANRAACEQTGLSLEQLQKWDSAIPLLGDKGEAFGRIAGVMHTGLPERNILRTISNEHGAPTVYNIEAFAIGANYVGVSSEIVTERVSAAEALQFQAHHDALTGLANRALLQERLSAVLERALHEETAGALLIMDLNQFKEVNDALGHLHGDKLLTEMAGRLRRLVPDAAVIARLGGDEFAVLLDEVEPREALEAARSIAESFADPVSIDGVTLEVGVSVGVALFPTHSLDGETLTQRADSAMYQAKRSGTGVGLFTSDQTTSSFRRLQLMSDLRTAITAGELFIEYQPMINIASNRVVNVEALIRWRHPEFGILQPLDFIELAEVSGLVQPLTEFVLRTASAEIARLNAAGLPVGVSVNLSVRNLYDPSLLDAINLAINHSGLRPDLLEVELTESELMDDSRQAMEVLGRIRSLGVGVSVDDFGTGYSSLSYLRDLPITTIKIDRRFVTDMSTRDDIVVRTIIELGHNLGLTVVAEGVEELAQLQELAALGCDKAQGFLVSRPLSIDALERFLRDAETFNAATWEQAVTHG